MPMLPSVKRRLAVATTCYALLGMTGVLFLDGMLRWAVLCFMAILAVKSFAHAHKDEEIE